MKRIAIIAAVVTGIVAAPAVVVASDSDGKSDTTRNDPYELAHNVSSPLGPLYGPVQAGSASSTSYGYIAR